MWYRHPATGLGSLWEEHVVTAGPDVWFDIEEHMPGYEGSLIVFASEFFNKKLTVYQVGLGATQGG